MDLPQLKMSFNKGARKSGMAGEEEEEDVEAEEEKAEG